MNVRNIAPGVPTLPDEQLIAKAAPSASVTWSRYFFTLGLWEIWRRRQRVVVTNQRIITTRGLLSKSQRMLPIGKVQDASLQLRFWVGRVVVTTAGGAAGSVDFPTLSRPDARNIVNAIQRAVHESSG